MYFRNDRIERRCLPSSELRFDESGDSPKIFGYAAVFNRWADIGGMFREKVAPGAFKKTIKESDIRALWNHDPNFILGRNGSDTLYLKEDSKGLSVEINPVDATWANDLAKSMRRGDVNQMSFGFRVNEAEDDYNENTRILKDVTLFDVSVVTFPAYPTTTAEVRSAFRKKSDPSPDFEAFDEAIRKIKDQEELTEEDYKALRAYLPDLSEPPAKHSGTNDGPPAKHPEKDTRKGDKVKMLITKVDHLMSVNNIRR